MKTILIIIGLLVLAVVIYFFILGARSKSGEAPGLSADNLAQCGTKPNCVCSEQREKNNFYIAPLAIKPGVPEPLATAKTFIQEMGGEIVKESGDYLAATFTSGIFRFVDDVEIRRDQENQVLQVRSASRVGHSDMGANRKRMEQFRTLFQQRQL